MSVNVPSPMPGTILKILVKVGDTVRADDEIALLEAMKMEVPICAPVGGRVTEILVQETAGVQPDQVLMVIE